MLSSGEFFSLAGSLRAAFTSILLQASNSLASVHRGKRQRPVDKPAPRRGQLHPIPPQHYQGIQLLRGFMRLAAERIPKKAPSLYLVNFFRYGEVMNFLALVRQEQDLQAAS